MEKKNLIEIFTELKETVGTATIELRIEEMPLAEISKYFIEETETTEGNYSQHQRTLMTKDIKGQYFACHPCKGLELESVLFLTEPTK